MRVALFGGSFNPPHVAHQISALYVLETAPVDQLWFMPCFKHPFDKELEGFDHRMEMCRLAAIPLAARTRVIDIEKQLGGESYTLRTVRALKEEYPEYKFSLVLGSDLLVEVGKWHGWDELRATVPFIVVGRGKPIPECPLALSDISSTQVRQMLRSGESVSGLVPREVIMYIKKHKLYGR